MLHTKVLRIHCHKFEGIGTKLLHVKSSEVTLLLPTKSVL